MYGNNPSEHCMNLIPCYNKTCLTLRGETLAMNHAHAIPWYNIVSAKLHGITSCLRCTPWYNIIDLLTSLHLREFLCSFLLSTF